MANKFEITNDYMEGNYHFTIISNIDLFPEDVQRLRWHMKTKIEKGFFSDQTQRYHYLTHQDHILTPEQCGLIEKRGLKLILGPTQQEELEKQGANLDCLPLFRFPK